VAASGADANLHKAGETGFFRLVEFGQGLVDVPTLLAQFVALLVDLLHHQLELPDFTRRLLVDMDDFANLGDREADTAATQNFLQETTVSSAVETRATATLRMQQASSS